MESDDGVERAFGRRIRALRQAHNWTQERLAAEAQMDRSYVSHVERGETNVTLANIAKFAWAFRLSLPDLFHGVALAGVDQPWDENAGRDRGPSSP